MLEFTVTGLRIYIYMTMKMYTWHGRVYTLKHTKSKSIWLAPMHFFTTLPFDLGSAQPFLCDCTTSELILAL